MRNELTRRHVIAATVGGALWAAGAAPSAAALNTAQAKALIDAAVAEIQQVINSGQSREQMFVRFEQIFRKYADVPTIARTALGPAARTASSAELRAYTAAFARYMARKYGARFREFIGGRIEVQDARKVKTFYEVKTTTILRGKAPFQVVYLVSDRSGRNLFFDMYVEGVSLLKSEAVEIRAMLDRNRGNIMGMVADLQRAA